MRINSLLSAAEAAGFAMAITEEMAAEQDAAMEAASEAVRWPAGHEATPGTKLLLAREIARPGWIPDWVAQYWRGTRATA